MMNHQSTMRRRRDADRLIVSARIAGEAGVADKHVTLFLMDPRTPGLTMRPWPLHDGSWAAEVVLDSVQVDAESVLGEAGSGLPALQSGLTHAIAALGAELLGGMERAIEITAELVVTTMHHLARVVRH